MAAVDGDLDWSSVKFLFYDTGSNAKNNLYTLLKFIDQSEKFLSEQDINENKFCFYFVTLAANYIGHHCNLLEKSQLSTIISDCNVLLKCLLTYMGQIKITDSWDGYSTHLNLALAAIAALCSGKPISTTEFISVVAFLKEWPSNAPVFGEKERESKKSLAYSSIADQMTKPLDRSKIRLNDHLKKDEKDIKKLLIENNISNLQKMGGNNVIFKTCTTLPILKRYITDIQLNSLEENNVRLNSDFIGAKSSYRYVLLDITFIEKALALPIFEPLTVACLQQLTSIMTACLRLALFVQGIHYNTSTSTDSLNVEDDVMWNQAVQIIEKTVNIMQTVSATLKKFSYSVHQNYYMIAIWVLINGLQEITLKNYAQHLLKDEQVLINKVKEVSKSSSIKNSFNVLTVVLANEMLNMVVDLLENAKKELASDQLMKLVDFEPEIIPAQLDICSKARSCDRLLRIFHTVPFIRFLYQLAAISHKKVMYLLLNKNKTNGNRTNSLESVNSLPRTPDSGTSEEEDEDNESLFGAWFEEALTLGDQQIENISSRTQGTNYVDLDKSVIDTSNLSLVPETDNPEGYLALILKIFNMLDVYFLSTESDYVSSYMSKSIQKDHLIILAKLIGEIDWAPVIYDLSSIIESHQNVSSSIGIFVHNLIAKDYLSAVQQDEFLELMGVKIPQDSLGCNWSLQLYPRTLAVLAQVLLKKPSAEKDELSMYIWLNLINSLSTIIVYPALSNEDFEDLNIEHAQLLIFLFNLMSLTHKKGILLAICNAIIGANSYCCIGLNPVYNNQILALSRLLLLFDYLVRRLYDVPEYLLSQVEWNLLRVKNNLKLDNDEVQITDKNTYMLYNSIEENFRKRSNGCSVAVVPCFYKLLDDNQSSNDVPKLDGLALNFMLNHPDKLSYPQLIQELIDITTILNLCKRSNEDYSENENITDSSSDPLTLCSIQYCFRLAWKLLLSLPVPLSQLQLMMEDKSEGFDTASLLYFLIWGSRACSKVYTNFLKDGVHKQIIGLACPESSKVAESLKSNDLISNVATAASLLKYDYQIAKSHLIQQLCHSDSSKKICFLKLLDIILFDCVISKMYFQARSEKMAEEIIKSSNSEFIQTLMPYCIELATLTFTNIKNNLLHQIFYQNQTEKYSPGDITNLKIILSMANNHSSLEFSPITYNLPTILFERMPPWVASVLTKWNSVSVGPQLKAMSLDILPEPLLQQIVKDHAYYVSSQTMYLNTPSLKRLLSTLIVFITENIQLCTDFKLRSDFANLLSSMAIDCSSEYLLEYIIPTLEKFNNPGDHDPSTMISIVITKNIRKLAVQFKHDDTNKTDYLVEKALIHCLLWIEQLIFEFPSARYAILRTFCVNSHKEEISMRKFISSGVFVKLLVRLTNRFFSNLKTNYQEDIKIICRAIILLSTDPKNRLDLWLQRIIVGWNKDKDLIDAGSTLSQELSTFLSDKHNSVKNLTNNISFPMDPDENFELIKNMIDFIVALDSSDELKTTASLCFLDTLIPIVTYSLAFENGDGFSKMFNQMVRLADYGGPIGHEKLYNASVKLLDTIKNWLKTNINYLQSDDPKHVYPPVIIASNCVTNYLSDVIAAMLHQNSDNLPSLDSMSLFYYDGMELDGFLPNHDGSSEGLNEDSDEDSLYHRLCTFTVTQKEFMNQHWYHCHTCKMVEGVGVCSICAKVCHRGHDVTYAKFGNFFCDCGAKDNNFCQALTKRNPNSILDTNSQKDKTTSVEGDNSTAEPEKMDSYNSSTSRQNQDPRNLNTRSLDYDSVVLSSLSTEYRHLLMGTVVLDQSHIIEPTLELCSQLLNVVIKSGQNNSAIGCNQRAIDSLNCLEESEKTIEVSDNLMLPTMGSQEGAFENVKMNFSGDQGQTIRQLLSAHMIRRVAMCCLSSLHGKRQHLVAVSHDKGKIAVLQMSSLLKQSDVSKRKLTLTRLSSVSIPFTVLSVNANPVNEDFLSVCGLKDCHILTFNTSGTVNDHIVLHPTLEVGNFLIRSIWLPGSQTCLALVSSEFVKIYDLSKDVLSPQFYFLVPTGKIRDVTFMCTEKRSTMILMSSGGYIYTQDMDSSSSAVHGPFYVTNTIDIVHPDISDINGQVCGGGVSVYYSHTLSLLMFSYCIPGRTFMAPLYENNHQDGIITTLQPVFAINSQIPSPSAKNKNNISQANTSAPPTQPMWQWSEVPGHPGLVCAILQSSNTPVVFMITPKVISVQEIKLAQTKTKITDMVAVRHPLSNGDYRTTLIILCEDGSLRMFLAAKELTDFWLSPSIQPSCHITSSKQKKKKTHKSGRLTGNSSSFPVDFFEYCVAMNDIEFGGNDLLQVYNPQQIKHRLNSNGMYLVSTKPRFSIEVNNDDATMVITGIRINVGCQDIGRVPGYIEVLGRTFNFNLLPVLRSRWFDFPLTREESLQSDKKLTIIFGPSRDAEGVTMIDSLKIYGKTKESFGWPDEVDDISSGTIFGSPSTSTLLTSNQFNPQDKELPLTGLSISHLDKFVIGLLSILINSFRESNFITSDESERFLSNKAEAINIALKLLNHSTQACIQLHSKLLLAVSQPEYHTLMDQSILTHVLMTLNEYESASPKYVDAEAFYRLILITRSIAVCRPHNLFNFELSDQKLLAKCNTSPYIVLIRKLVGVFWELHKNKPKNPSYCTIYIPGLKHTEAVVYALVEIINALLLNEINAGFPHSEIELISLFYHALLINEDVAVSYTAKTAITRSLKPLVLVKNKHNLVHGNDTCKESTEEKNISNKEPKNEEQASSQELPDENNQYEVDEPIILLDPRGAEPQNHDRQNMEVLIGNVQFPGLIIQPDADDEAMVELAIALSLQDNDGMGNNAELQNIRQNLSGYVEIDELNAPADLQNLQEISSQNNENGQNSDAQSLQQGHLSDTTASPAGSDDEDTNAVQENMRLSTTENSQLERGEVDEEIGNDRDLEVNNNLHTLRLFVVGELLKDIPNLSIVGGKRAIPYFQVISSIVMDMDLNDERDKECFVKILQNCIATILHETLDFSNLHIRNPKREIIIIVMRFIGVLLARPKSSSKSSSDHTTYISQTTASMLKQAHFIPFCLKALQILQEYWAKSNDNDDNGATVVSVLLEPSGPSQVPDMSPFFLKPYSVSQSKDIFFNYPVILTELFLRLPYQIQKNWSQLSFEPEWLNVLCEFMSLKTISPFIKRQVRKLLLFVCGNKDKYRQIRDMHALSTSIKNFQITCNIDDHNTQTLNLPYDKLVELVEGVKVCVDIASSRMLNWQLYCRKDNAVLVYLMRAACLLDEGVSSTILHLLQYAICGAKNQSGTPSVKESKSKVSKVAEDVENAMLEEAQCMILIKEMNKRLNKDILARFVKTFLLETNSTHIRWQAHALVLSIYRNSEHEDQEKLLELLWTLWPQLPTYGRKASQFVDLLGYFSFKYNQKAATSTKYVEQAIELLKTQNYKLACHPNANLYTQVSQYVDLEGFYLESEPCMVCNNPEIPFSNIKLTSIKVDSKFTTTTQIVKLMGSHTINKIVLRITDLKRTKMVRTMNLFYNNRYVQAVVELKNKPAMWHKAKEITLTSGQTEVKVEFSVPIVACNLLIEYASFYENLHASSETLQCPRCSATVPANPGVCSNCGENVFQCHKCRAINYDEKDPFLCHSCGFCKYAKFDYVLTAKPCCAVDPIENDDDRNKTVSSINSNLEKADRLYKQLVSSKPVLENMLVKVMENRLEKSNNTNAEEGQNPNIVPVSGFAAVVNGAMNNNISSGPVHQVNRSIQLLAQKYGSECRNTFEDLSRIVQKVLASRKELVAYDQKKLGQVKSTSRFNGSFSAISISDSLMSISTSQNIPLSCSLPNTSCYGCITAALEHCFVMLRALATNMTLRKILLQQGLIQELVENNIRRGSVQTQEEVRNLLCILIQDNPKATEDLCGLLSQRISLTIRGPIANADLAFAVRPEISLLATMLYKEDSCWEQKAKCVMQLFFMTCKEFQSSAIVTYITLPCLKMMRNIIKPPASVAKINKDKSPESLSTVEMSDYLMVDFRKWAKQSPEHMFSAWRQRLQKKIPDVLIKKPRLKTEIRQYYLASKYFKKWRLYSLRDVAKPFHLTESSWLKHFLFCSSTRLLRQVACAIFEGIAQVPERKKEILDLLTGFLTELGTAGENCAEFLALYQNLIQQIPWKQYLALRGVLIMISDIITKEIKHLHYLEETTLTSDLAQGFVLKSLTGLLASFLEVERIKQQYKGRLVGAILNGYLSLRRLVVQRTRLIDETQAQLLDLLEEMTCGTESESKAFMAICVETVEKCDPQDVRTPVFVFERLCSIIYPEENDVGEFYMNLDKDPQQEDFLQGRMLGNPYNSNESGLGPLMRDVKNKICQDCELVALLEDDNGMELLVNNKIISLDLPVKEVYKKIWLPEGGDNEAAMHIVYRMRGLLGDATEEFIETLDVKTDQEVNNEEVYKMANVMADCRGLEVVLYRLSTIEDLSRSRPLLQVLLKLLGLCVKVKHNQKVLTDPKLGSIPILLSTLELCLSNEADGLSNTVLTEQTLDILEKILSNATSQNPDAFAALSETFGPDNHIRYLLHCASNARYTIVQHLTRVLAALTYNNKAKMIILMDHFASVISDFEKFDDVHSPRDEQMMNLFCDLTYGIENNSLGNTLKDYILSLGVINNVIQYISRHAPTVKSFLNKNYDKDEWKEFIAKPSLKYILRFWTGLANGHEPTQTAVSDECIQTVHCLEQVSSDEHVGSLAENLLEALKTNPIMAEKIEQVREQTKAEKKRLAMAMRQKQLGQLGMRTNEKGQVTAETSLLQQVEDLGEETGLVCVICREGYKFQPTKVLGIYTFTKRCVIEEHEVKARKTIGYSTVTHFNVVHFDCHMSAVRLARVRDEWESAALQNASTKCNGLLPMWGPSVAESAYANSLARHNSYLQEATGQRDISYSQTVHDLKLLLLRFAQEKSFHEDTGGGGPQSNMNLVPYLMHMTLYVINTTRRVSAEERNLVTYLEPKSADRLIEHFYDTEGPLYWLTMTILLTPYSKWIATNRIMHLHKIVLMAHVYHTNSSIVPNVRSVPSTPHDYSAYKPALMFFALINTMYEYYFKTVEVNENKSWSVSLADYIRHNDEALLKSSEKIMSTFSEDFLPCTSFEEFCDVACLGIAEPSTYITSVLSTYFN